MSTYDNGSADHSSAHHSSAHHSSAHHDSGTLVSTACAIALGANLGQPIETLNAAVQVLSATTGITVTARSSWYLTRAVGPPQPDYLNGCVLLETAIEPHDLLTILLNIENQFGRVREVRWGARTLDLDLVLYGDRVVQSPRLEIPHPRFRDRAFVLVPLAEIAPDWIDPISNSSIEKLRQVVDCSEVKLHQD
jgi:2-amino-4-hydroxy-6-hydroxymethyldihydropteridine diphosphokinase